MWTFHEYLIDRRSGRELSQHELAQELAEFNDEFFGVDGNTISRWERLQSNPNPKRKVLIIHYFCEKPEDVLPFRPPESRRRSLEARIKYILTERVSLKKFDSQIGNFPSSERYSDYAIERLGKVHSENGVTDLIFEFDHAVCSDPPAVPMDIIVDCWAAHPFNPCLVCSRHSQYFGHLIAVRLSEAAFEAVVNGDLAEAEISEPHLVDTDQVGSLYVYSLHALNRLIGAYFLAQIIDHLISHRDSTVRLGALCVTRDAMRLAKNFAMEPVKFGPENPQSEVKALRKNFDWITCAGFVGNALLERDLTFMNPPNAER